MDNNTDVPCQLTILLNPGDAAIVFTSRDDESINARLAINDSGLEGEEIVPSTHLVATMMVATMNDQRVKDIMEETWNNLMSDLEDNPEMPIPEVLRGRGQDPV